MSLARRLLAPAAVSIVVAIAGAGTAASTARASVSVAALPAVPAVAALPTLPAVPGGLGDPLGAGAGGPLGGGLGGSLAGAGPISTLPELIGLTAVGGFVLSAARFSLDETAAVMSRTTTPQLRSTWFSATYWRMTAIAAVLTLPFLFAAAVQAVIRSDLSLIVRAAFGYLPLAMLAIAIAAPLTMLLLAASDELAHAVAAASGDAAGNFLGRAAVLVGDASALGRSPFLAFLVGGFTVLGALVLWIELLIREAAVYVIVLMLPLAFAAMVWPARRVWATRAVELLVALVLSKFAIVAVLSLGGAAMSANFGVDNVQAWLAGLVLLLMAAFTPWALLRFVPVAELAAGAVGSLRHDVHQNARSAAEKSKKYATRAHDATRSGMADMRRDAAVADSAAREAARRASVDDGASPAEEPQAEREDAATYPPATQPSADAQPATPPSADAQPATQPSADAQPATQPSADAQPATPPSADALPATTESPGPDEHSETPNLLAGFAKRVQLDHELKLEVGADGSKGWLEPNGAPRRAPTEDGPP